MTKDKHQPDYFLIILIILILIIGLIFLNSASSVMGYNNFKDPFYYLKHQLISGFLPGVILFLIGYRITIENLKRAANVLFLVGLVLVLAVFLPGIGADYGQAQRWLNFRFFSFQPIEIFKLVFIFFLARFFARRQDKINDFYITILPFLLIIILAAVPVFLQPNFSALMILILIGFGMFFLAGVNPIYIISLVVLSLPTIFFLLKSKAYRLARLLSFVSPGEDTGGISYHIQQALIAIGSGGLFGLGLGYSRQKFFYLPESFGDSAFAIMAEEAGFIFTTIIISLFFLLIWRGFKIAKNSEDQFSCLVAAGISFWFGFQIIINIGGMLNLLPITGIPLPLISYGGSAMIANLAALGILANISKQTKIV